MNTSLPCRTITISDFRRNPAKAIREALPRPLAVLHRTRLELVAVPPNLYDWLVERLPATDREEMSRKLMEAIEPPSPNPAEPSVTAAASMS